MALVRPMIEVHHGDMANEHKVQDIRSAGEARLRPQFTSEADTNQNLSEQADQHPPEQSHGGHGGHGWMMIACCIPMLVIAVVLVGTGVVNPGFLVTAIACTVMMALMMRMMPGHGGGTSDR